MFYGVANEEFKKISSTKVAKEAWTILETTYEGTKAVKTMKLQRLTSSFEEIRMEEDETFDEFYAKLKDIMNSAFNLGESIAESKIVRKILRSLLERFHAKLNAHITSLIFMESGFFNKSPYSHKNDNKTQDTSSHLRLIIQAHESL